MKLKQKQEAIVLRKNDGLSINKISEKLGVSKSTISIWVRGIKLTDEQTYKNHCNYIGIVTPEMHKLHIEKCLMRRIKSQEEGKKKMRENSKDFAFGCALFWGEGDKAQVTVGFTNTDEVMLVFFINFLRKYFEVKNEDFSIRINCYLNNNITLEKIQEYWINKFGLSKDNLIKATIKNKYYGDIRSNKCPYGVCRVTVHNVDVVQQLYGAIKEMVGDNTDRWINFKKQICGSGSSGAAEVS